ncbi:MAG: DUF3626 domain-containing protein [Christensenellaceae bacterium]|jgi:hypothetical protein
MIHFAVEAVDKNAKKTETDDIRAIERLLAAENIAVDIVQLKNQLLYACDVTINFHPDRFDNTGKLIIENLLVEGMYENQYKTGTSNGARTAQPGGDRDLWEKALFYGAYHKREKNLAARPKYGALNIHNYTDGASARFGACFFTVKPHVIKRCTFAFGDSSTAPEVIGTEEHFYGVLRALLEEVAQEGRLLNKKGFTLKSAVQYILSLQKDKIEILGRNLDDCIEAHIHGEISLLEDIESFYIDGAYHGTEIDALSKRLSERYDIALHDIPKRTYSIDKIDDVWRGPLARPVAEEIMARFPNKERMLDAYILGCAAQDSILNSKVWECIASEFDLFQNFKYLWHFIAYFGHVE